MGRLDDLLEGFDPDGAGAAEPAKKDADEAAPTSAETESHGNTNPESSNNPVATKTTDAEAIAFARALPAEVQEADAAPASAAAAGSDGDESGGTSVSADGSNDDGSATAAPLGSTPEAPADNSAPHSTEDTNNAGDTAEVHDTSPGSANDETGSKTGIGTVLGALADALPPASESEPTPTKKAKKSPARRRVELQHQANALRGQARTRRAALADERAKEQPDADQVAELEREIDALDGELLKIDIEIEQRMERDARRADRDRAIRALDRDPATGKRRNGPYAYDPRTSEMQYLYRDKSTPHAVFADGAKLIRNDGGQYGLAGGILRALLDGAARAGETLSPRLQFELTKALCWDALERVHGIGAGYCRDAAWIAWLWSQLTGTPLDLAALPVRKPLTTFGEWVIGEFDKMYAEALRKLGLIESTGVELSSTDPAPVDTPVNADANESSAASREVVETDADAKSAEAASTEGA